MMITKLIKEKIKQRKVITGYGSVIKAIKMSRPKLIVFANNLQQGKIKTIKYNAQIARIEVKPYPKSSTDLGLICGKPFPVSILAIKE